MEKLTSTLRLRMSYKDVHYGGNLVDGAHGAFIWGYRHGTAGLWLMAMKDCF